MRSKAGAYKAITSVAAFTLSEFAKVVPIKIPPALPDLWANLATFILLFWIQPVALRLGWWRSLLWLGSAAILLLPIRDFFVLGLALALLGLTASLYRRRTRAWMVVPAAGIMIITTPMWGPQELPFWWFYARGSFICGFILLFGTELIKQPASSANLPDPRDP